MEEENYIRLSTLISNPNFNYLEQIPVESHKNNATCSYLHLAAKFDSVMFIRMWLKKGYPINGVDYRGWTALHWAVYYNSPYSFRQLLKSGVRTDVKIPYVYKNKNEQLRGRTAIDMIMLLNRNKILRFYRNYRTLHSKSIQLVRIVEDNESVCEVNPNTPIPSAESLSESYIIHKMPQKSVQYTMIEDICEWSVYSDNYCNFLWKNNLTGQVCYKCPDEIRNIRTISYI
jgi:ankyrin repeat protein